MAKTISKKIAVLKTIKPYISVKALAEVGSSLINSTILYAAPLWGCTTKSNLDKIQASQTRAARMILSKGWSRTKTKSHRQDALTELKWPNVSQIVHMATCNLTKKALSGNLSIDMNNMFTKSKTEHSRPANRGRIDHKGKIDQNQNIYSVMATNMYNTLPQYMKDPDMTDKKFKNEMKRLSLQMNHLPTH